MALSGSLTGISSDQVTGGTAGIKVYSNTSTAHHVNVQHTAEGTGLTTTMHCTCTRSQYTIAYVSIKEMGYTAAAAPPSFRHGEPALCGIGLSSVLRPRQWENFYRSKDPTNSIKILKEQIVHRQIKHTISRQEHKTASPLIYNNMGWLGDGSHRGQGCQAWMAVGLPRQYPYIFTDLEWCMHHDD